MSVPARARGRGQGRETAPEELVRQLEDGTLHPAYLIAGPEPLRVLEAADAVRASARAAGYGDREVFDVDGRGFDWSQLEATLRAPGLFAPRRLVEVRLPSGKPGKEGSAALSAFCEQPPDDILLLVTCGDWSRQHGGKWSDAIASVGCVVIAWAVKPHAMPGWIEQRLRSRGLVADHDAVALLAERVEGNLLAAAQEIDKLALLADDRRLDAATMHELVADAARFDVFRLIDGALNGQPAHVLRILAGLRAEGLAVPALMGMVVMELQRAALFAGVQARGGNLASEFRAQRVWEAKQAVFRRALQRHGPARWERFLAEAGRVDRMSKGRAAGDPWQALERLLLAVADKRALPMLA